MGIKTKKFIFGYGSLVSAKDAARTLGRPVEFHSHVSLQGWLRDWSVVVDNSMVVLNVRRPLPHETPNHPNGVLIEIANEELLLLDARERHYQRVDITDHLVNPPGQVYVYSGLPEFLLNDSYANTTIPAAYRELVEQSFQSLGPDIHQKYTRSTLQPSSALQFS